MPNPIVAVAGAGLGGAALQSSATKKATQAQVGAAEQAQQFTREAQQQARGDLLNLFPAAQQSLQSGFQGALDVFGRTLPEQARQFQGGNVAAQQALLAGLPLQQAAILGGNVDFSQLQPFQSTLPGGAFAVQGVNAGGGQQVGPLGGGFFDFQLPQFQQGAQAIQQPQPQLPSTNPFAGVRPGSLGGALSGFDFIGTDRRVR